MDSSLALRPLLLLSLSSINWMSSTDGSGVAIRTVLLDYRKALDLADHSLLIAKLYSLGIRPSIINWIIEFLRDRSQRVKLNNNCFSNWMNKARSVVFLAMINDLSTPTPFSSIWKFADDSPISSVVQSNLWLHLHTVMRPSHSWLVRNKPFPT